MEFAVWQGQTTCDLFSVILDVWNIVAIPKNLWNLGLLWNTIALTLVWSQPWPEVNLSAVFVCCCAGQSQNLMDLEKWIQCYVRTTYFYNNQLHINRHSSFSSRGCTSRWRDRYEKEHTGAAGHAERVKTPCQKNVVLGMLKCHYISYVYYYRCQTLFDWSHITKLRTLGHFSCRIQKSQHSLFMTTFRSWFSDSNFQLM